MESRASQAMSAVGRRVMAPKAFYFFFFAAMGSLLPFLALYYRGTGLSTPAIGLLTGIGPLVTLLAAPFWGGVADLTRRHRLLLLLAIAGTMAATAALSQATTLWALISIVTAYAWFSAPVIPLVDNSVLALLGSRRADYGKQRMWGAVGWGVAGLSAGIAIDATDLRYIFLAYFFLMGAAMVAASRITVIESTIGVAFWRGLRLLARDARWLVFLAVVLVAGIGAGVTNNFLFLYLQDMGATRTLMGWSLMVSTLSEIPIFFYSNRLLARWGAPGLLAIALAAYVIRLLAYALMPSAWLVLPIHVLHGMTFSALWVAGVSYAYEIAPPGLSATAQGLFSGMTMGLGAAAGALLGGLLYEAVGPQAMFMWVAVVVAAGLVAFLASGVVRRRHPSADIA